MNNDFKHVMHDLTNIYIGGKLSYAELMNMDEVPFKLKSIFSHNMLKEVAGDTCLENHIFYINDTDLSYFVYKQLKARFKLSIFSEDGHGKGKPGYKAYEYKIDEIIKNEEIMSKKDQIIVEEMRITKMSLMSIQI